MDDERCDLCGKLKTGTRARDTCQAGLMQHDPVIVKCDGTPLGDMLDIEARNERIREAMRAPLLRAALAETLEEWEAWASTGECRFETRHNNPFDRIAELRAKFLK